MVEHPTCSCAHILRNVLNINAMEVNEHSYEAARIACACQFGEREREREREPDGGGESL